MPREIYLVVAPLESFYRLIFTRPLRDDAYIARFFESRLHRGDEQSSRGTPDCSRMIAFEISGEGSDAVNATIIRDLNEFAREFDENMVGGQSNGVLNNTSGR